MRYLIQLSFHGKNYHGWQKQLNAHAVQSELDLKLSLLLGSNIETLGCGRTDTGVHAREYFAHFDFADEIDTERLVFKLSQVLPGDIAVQSLKKVHDEFHARFDADYRVYEYWIVPSPNPFLRDLAWYQYGELDLEKMNEAALILLAHKDFECFSKVQTDVKTFDCEVMHAHWHEEKDKLVFTIKANRFLRNMVRAIVGTLIEVGRNKITIDDFRKILESKNRSEAGQSVPAHGLHLVEIHYPNI